MTEQDRERWNTRYADQATPDYRPAASLVGLTPVLRPARPGARALDLACGAGRNSLYLAELGYEVDAWDVADAGLALLQAELDRRAAAGRPLTVRSRRIDLDAATIPAATYELIVCYYFLDRELFPSMAAALRPGGLLLVETLLDAGRGRERTMNPTYRLALGELPTAFATLEQVEYVEDRDNGVARLVARAPARQA